MKQIMRLIMWTAAVGTVFVCGSAMATTNLYWNDFGTATQVSEWTVVSGSGLYRTNTWARTDRNGDGQAQTLMEAGPNSITIQRQIKAPAGQYFKDPVFSAWSRGNGSSWGSGLQIWISADGSTWNHTISTADDPAEWNLISSAVGDTNYNRISSLWVKATLLTGFANTPLWAAGKMFDVSVTATMIPAAYTVYQNDFGTQTQLNEWTITGTGLHLTNIWARTDRDGDGLAQTVIQDGTWRGSTMIRKLNALPGKHLQFPRLTAWTRCNNSSWGSSTTIYLSADGVNWDHMIATGDDGAEWQMTSSAIGDTKYQDLKSVWIKAAFYTGGQQPWANGKLFDLLVTGESVPGTTGTGILFR